MTVAEAQLAAYVAEVVNAVGAWSWNDLQTPDPVAAAPFYEQLFGWTVQDIPGADGQYRSVLHEGRSIAGMMRASGGVQQPYWTVYVGVESVDDALARASEAGGRTLVEPVSVPAGRFAVGMDPQGAVHCIFEGQYDD